MKKKINVLLCILTVAFCFAGCGNQKETVEYEQEVLEQYAEGILTSFAVMDDAAFAQFTEGSDLQVNLTMIQTGLPVEKEALVSMINSWKASIDECGAYKSHGEYTAEADKSGVTLTTDCLLYTSDAADE